MRKLIAVGLAMSASLMSACQPAPRSVTYFDAHATARSDVMSRCRAGSHRGEECKNAQASTEKAAKLKTMNDYRRGF